MKTCPFCAEDIHDAAVVCKHCQRDLTGKPTTVVQTRETTSPLAKVGAVLLVILLVLFIAGLFY